MGYRNYLSIIENNAVELIEEMSYEQLAIVFGDGDGEDCFFAPYQLPQTILHNLGEIEAVDDERMYSVGKPLFKTESTHSRLEHYKPYLVGKEGLLMLIQLYQDKVIHHFKGLLVDDTKEGLDDKTATQKQESYVKSMLEEWENGMNINLNEKTASVSNSWKYEYIIFELVRQLKTIDFENNTLIFYGY